MTSFLEADLSTSRTPGSVTTNSWNRLQWRKRNTQCSSPNFIPNNDICRSTCIDSSPRFTRSLRRCGSLEARDVEATANSRNAQTGCKSNLGLFLRLNSSPKDNMNHRHVSDMCETQKFKLRGDCCSERLQTRNTPTDDELTSFRHPNSTAPPDGTKADVCAVRSHGSSVQPADVNGDFAEAYLNARSHTFDRDASFGFHSKATVNEASSMCRSQKDYSHTPSPVLVAESMTQSAIPVGDSEGISKINKCDSRRDPSNVGASAISRCCLGRSHSSGPEVTTEESTSWRNANRSRRSIWMGSPNCSSGDSELTCETAVSECNFGGTCILPGFKTANEILPQSEGSANRTTTSGAPLVQYPHTLCWCPCLNCATCPLRASSRNCRSKPGMSQKTLSVSTKLKQTDSGTTGHGCNTKLNNNNGLQAQGSRVDSEPASEKPTCWNNPFCRGISRIGRRVWDGVLWIYFLEAKDDPKKYRFDSRIIPEVPLPRRKQRLLEITELPFLILWVYFSYWALIVSLAAPHAPSTVWLSAVVAGLLVGIGLNANAYKSVTVPRRRGAIRHHRHARALLELRRYGESLDSVEMKIDWGMVIRFFIIPFGVSSLSGLTNYMREDFLLVFPRDPMYLMIAVLCPTVIVTLLVALRLLLLWRLRVRWSLQVLFLNGALVD